MLFAGYAVARIGKNFVHAAAAAFVAVSMR
jgi:hypothetical protein